MPRCIAIPGRSIALASSAGSPSPLARSRSGRSEIFAAQSVRALSEGRIEPMIRKVWLQQPIAFARVGPSRTPLSAFRWTQPDLRPRGTGRTTITPAATFDVDATTGVPTRRGEEEEFTLFRDEDGIRPVAPFFELHGDWDGRAEQSTALTTRVLEENGLSLSSLTWDIHHANHKAYSLTRAEGDRVEARA